MKRSTVELKEKPEEEKLINEENKNKTRNNETNEFRSVPDDDQSLLLFAYFTLFSSSACLFLKGNCMPFLCKEIGVDEKTFGYIQTTFAIGQLVGAPLYGRLSDMIGSKKALCVTYIGGATYFALHSVATSSTMLFIAQFPSLVMQWMPGNQILVSQITDENARPAALGRLGMSIGLAVIIGPFVGGQITKNFGMRASLLVAVFIGVMNSFLVLKIVPDKQSKLCQKDSKSSGGIFDLSKIREIVTLPGVPKILWIKLAIGLPMGIIQTMLLMITVKFFNLSAEQNGFVMVFIGIKLMLVQAVGVGQLTKLFSKKSILKGATFCHVLGCVFMFFVQNIVQFCLSLVPIMASTIIIFVLTDSLITEAVPQTQHGLVLGICASLQSSAMALGPTIGGLLIQKWGIAGFASFGATMSSILSATLLSW